jgi:hypothetical protein
MGVDGWAALKAVVWIGALVATTCAQAADFELIGHVQPEQPLPVNLQGATTRFSATTRSELNGRTVTVNGSPLALAKMQAACPN